MHESYRHNVHRHMIENGTHVGGCAYLDPQGFHRRLPKAGSRPLTQTSWPVALSWTSNRLPGGTTAAIPIVSAVQQCSPAVPRRDGREWVSCRRWTTRQSQRQRSRRKGGTRDPLRARWGWCPRLCTAGTALVVRKRTHGRWSFLRLQEGEGGREGGLASGTSPQVKKQKLWAKDVEEKHEGRLESTHIWWWGEALQNANVIWCFRYSVIFRCLILRPLNSLKPIKPIFTGRYFILKSMVCICAR